MTHKIGIETLSKSNQHKNMGLVTFYQFSTKSVEYTKLNGFTLYPAYCRIVTGNLVLTH